MLFYISNNLYYPKIEVGCIKCGLQVHKAWLSERTWYFWKDEFLLGKMLDSSGIIKLKTKIMH